MRTHTSYYMHEPEVVKQKIITLGEAYGMSQQKIDEHFENVAKQNSYQHCITIDQPTRNDVENIARHTFWSKRTKKKVAKRYRLPGRC